MGIDQKILVRARGLCVGVASALCGVVILSACGQKGNLYLPNDPEFQQRAKLPDIVRRQLPGNTATPAAAPASSTPPLSTTAPRNNATTPNAPSPAAAASAATGR